jgi:hypothetical protein
MDDSITVKENQERLSHDCYYSMGASPPHKLTSGRL